MAPLCLLPPGALPRMPLPLPPCLPPPAQTTTTTLPPRACHGTTCRHAHAYLPLSSPRHPVPRCHHAPLGNAVEHSGARLPAFTHCAIRTHCLPCLLHALELSAAYLPACSPARQYQNAAGYAQQTANARHARASSAANASFTHRGNHSALWRQDYLLSSSTVDSAPFFTKAMRAPTAYACSQRQNLPPSGEAPSVPKYCAEGQKNCLVGEDSSLLAHLTGVGAGCCCVLKYSWRRLGRYPMGRRHLLAESLS